MANFIESPTFSCCRKTQLISTYAGYGCWIWSWKFPAFSTYMNHISRWNLTLVIWSPEKQIWDESGTPIHAEKMATLSRLPPYVFTLQARNRFVAEIHRYSLLCSWWKKFILRIVVPATSGRNNDVIITSKRRFVDAVWRYNYVICFMLWFHWKSRVVKMPTLSQKIIFSTKWSI